MPTYEYRCPRGHEFEVFQRISDDPAADCPECGEAAERMISAGAGFLFKGEGFYITDYRSKEYKEKPSAEKGSGAPKEASKPADAPTAKPAEGSKSTSKPKEG